MELKLIPCLEHKICWNAANPFKQSFYPYHTPATVSTGYLEHKYPGAVIPVLMNVENLAIGYSGSSWK
jgi:hypothetical protein